MTVLERSALCAIWF